MSFLQKLFFLLLLIPFTSSLTAQQWVSTQPENRRVILEEFSGVRCNRCSDAHRIGYAIRDSHPGAVSIIALHPKGDWHTEPLRPGDPDLRNGYANRFYHQGNYGGPLYMPAGMVNRREWLPGKRAIGRELWAQAADSIRSERAPVNLAADARYNPNSQELIVDVEIFFTEKLTGGQKLCLVLTEDSLVVPQAGEGPDYRQNHVFRYNLTSDPYGEWIAVSPDSGTFIQKQYRFFNAADTFNMAYCRVVGFILSPETQELQSGGEASITIDPTANLDESMSAESSLRLHTQEGLLNLQWEMAKPGPVHGQLVDLQGRMVWSWEEKGLASGLHNRRLSLPRLAPGIYLWRMQAGGINYVRKVDL